MATREPDQWSVLHPTGRVIAGPMPQVAARQTRDALNKTVFDDDPHYRMRAEPLDDAPPAPEPSAAVVAAVLASAGVSTLMDHYKFGMMERNSLISAVLKALQEVAHV